MLDTPSYTPGQMRGLRRVFRAMNPFMVFLWKLGMGRMFNAWPAVTGRMLVICHRGRRSHKQHLTPVNYARIEGQIYCTAGFGPKTDWYRNILVEPRVELWLPQDRRRARAADVSDAPDRLRLLRQVIIASGFAGPLFGVDQRKLTDEQLAGITRDYRLIHFELEAADDVSRL